MHITALSGIIAARRGRTVIVLAAIITSITVNYAMSHRPLKSLDLCRRLQIRENKSQKYRRGWGANHDLYSVAAKCVGHSHSIDIHINSVRVDNGSILIRCKVTEDCKMWNSRKRVHWASSLPVWNEQTDSQLNCRHDNIGDYSVMDTRSKYTVERIGSKANMIWHAGPWLNNWQRRSFPGGRPSKCSISERSTTSFILGLHDQYSTLSYLLICKSRWEQVAVLQRTCLWHQWPGFNSRWHSRVWQMLSSVRGSVKNVVISIQWITAVEDCGCKLLGVALPLQV